MKDCDDMQFIDLKAQYQALREPIHAGIQAVLEHGQFIMGPQVKELEQKLASHVGVKHCISCANGTDALQMLYMAYGIGRGDAVFCPDITFIASVEPAYMLGARPVFCDVLPGSYNLCPASLERQIRAVLSEGKYTPKAVVVIDFLGNPADYAPLQEICTRYGLVLIEDAAQSYGASRAGRMCCSFGDAAITSFFPAKPLGCYGDGGAIFTNDDTLAATCETIRIHGKGPKGKYDNVRIGVNSRLDTLQAAILLPKLEALKQHEVDDRQRVAKRYDDAFAAAFMPLTVASDAISVYAQYALLAKDSAQRDAVIGYLSDKQIPNMVYYPTPQHCLPVFCELHQYGETFAQANDYCARTFSIPMHPYLGEAEQQSIIDAVLEAAR